MAEIYEKSKMDKIKEMTNGRPLAEWNKYEIKKFLSEIEMPQEWIQYFFDSNVTGKQFSDENYSLNPPKVTDHGAKLADLKYWINKLINECDNEDDPDITLDILAPYKDIRSSSPLYELLCKPTLKNNPLKPPQKDLQEKICAFLFIQNDKSLFDIRKRTTIIGRKADITLTDNDNLISRLHASITISQENILTIRDEGSENGTFIKVQKGQEIPLNSTTKLFEFGDYLLDFDSTESSEVTRKRGTFTIRIFDFDNPVNNKSHDVILSKNQSLVIGRRGKDEEEGIIQVGNDKKLAINDPNSKISKQHATLRKNEITQELILKDNNSTNGIYMRLSLPKNKSKEMNLMFSNEIKLASTIVANVHIFNNECTKTKCKNCKNGSNVVYFPCGHIVHCSSCMNKFEFCEHTECVSLEKKEKIMLKKPLVFEDQISD